MDIYGSGEPLILDQMDIYGSGEALILDPLRWIYTVVERL